MPPSEGEESMENVQLTNDYYNKIKFLEFASCFFAWIGVGVGIVEYELRYNYTQVGTLDNNKET